ncbi:pleckstrin homology domain-containing family J member 1-like isoform X2 [Branchiostoma lanceolatum]|uniref:Pleckstrin homology domain-containing family J member 1 n=2 Tax=Branchiostoma lanceolatum TaxID=7740 RepID=A0A8K0EAZ6_BRALA|nr:PLEKHJ1 [Branchiostoma lanceolatum]
MRYSEKELLSLALQSPDREGKILHRMSGTKGRLVEGYKDRLIRLKANFLFLFKTNEQGQILEPVGAVLLERCKLQPEPKADKANVFSIALQDDPECKYYFACRSFDECTDWLTALRNASYENMRSNILLLQGKLSRQTGQPGLQLRHIPAAEQ